MHLKLGKGFNQISGPNTVGFLIKINIMELILNLSEEKISNDELLEFEQSIGYELPRSYKKFILKNNGGVPSNKYFSEFSIALFFSFKYGKMTIDKIYKEFNNLVPKGFIAIADEPGGDFICINLNTDQNYGHIFYISHDNDVPLLVAESFEQFLDGLTEEYI